MPVTGSADLPLADRAHAWDAAAALKRVQAWAGGDQRKLERAVLFSDGSGNLTGLKLPFADIINGQLTAVWRGVVAAGQRLGQAQIPPDQRAGCRRILTGYYTKASRQFNDASITPPWTDMNAVIRRSAGR